MKGVSRQYKTPRILDRRITLSDYDGPLRQVIVTDLGHEEPTILLTNQLTRTAAKLVGRYAQRMIIENSIADGIDFFHMDALSSAVAMKVNCDLQLTLMASSLYRLLAGRIGRGYEHTESRHLFRDFVAATAEVRITESAIVVRYQKRAHNPLLIAAGFDTTETAIPWLGGSVATGVRIAPWVAPDVRGVKPRTNIILIYSSLCVWDILLGFFFCMGIQASTTRRN